LPPRPLVAVNQGYADYSQALRAGDEVAVIPPVAGG
jgi:molybdopterin converting factor small subunit